MSKVCVCHHLGGKVFAQIDCWQLGISKNESLAQQWPLAMLDIGLWLDRCERHMVSTRRCHKIFPETIQIPLGHEIFSGLVVCSHVSVIRITVKACISDSKAVSAICPMCYTLTHMHYDWIKKLQLKKITLFVISFKSCVNFVTSFIKIVIHSTPRPQNPRPLERK